MAPKRRRAAAAAVAEAAEAPKRQRGAAPAVAPLERRVITTMEQFREDVHLKVQEVPTGRLATYGSVAGALGSRKVARQVGWALGDSDCAAEGTPWWRIVNSKGEISLHDGASRQRDLLAAEGVEFAGVRTKLDAQRIVDFAARLHDFGAS